MPKYAWVAIFRQAIEMASHHPGRTLKLGRIAGVVLLAVLSLGAHAQYSATAYLPNGQSASSTPADASFSYVSPDGSSSLVSFTANPIASVTASVTAGSPEFNTFTNAGGIMTYRFEVVAQPTTYVPIDFSGLFSSYQGTPGALAATSFTVQTVNSSVSTYSTFQSYLYGACGAPVCLQFTTFNNTGYTFSQSDAQHVEGSFAGSLDMLTNTDGHVIGMVQLVASTRVAAAIGGFSSANAFIDPHLEIDADFLMANPGATLTLTRGVGNEIAAVAPVPEPETYALMLAGLGILSAVARRRRVAKTRDC